jgi:hypothetical protein
MRPSFRAPDACYAMPSAKSKSNKGVAMPMAMWGRGAMHCEAAKACAPYGLPILCLASRAMEEARQGGRNASILLFPFFNYI